MTWFDTLTHNQTKALRNTETGLGLLITKCLKYVSDFKQSITCFYQLDELYVENYIEHFKHSLIKIEITNVLVKTYTNRFVFDLEDIHMPPFVAVNVQEV